MKENDFLNANPETRNLDAAICFWCFYFLY